MIISNTQTIIKNKQFADSKDFIYCKVKNKYTTTKPIIHQISMSLLVDCHKNETRVKSTAFPTRVVKHRVKWTTNNAACK